MSISVLHDFALEYGSHYANSQLSMPVTVRCLTAMIQTYLLLKKVNVLSNIKLRTYGEDAVMVS
jgi:hypothetical protein